MSPKKDAFSHLQNYITPTVNLLRVNKSDFEEEENLNQIACTALMKSNRFNFLPLMDDNGSCSEFLSIDIFNQDESKKITPPRLALNHHALSAILWTIGSREFVCPVWDEQQQRLAGIFTLENLTGNEFRDALLLSLVSPEALRYIDDETQRKRISGERVAYANQLVDTLSALDDFVFSSDQVTLDSEQMDELIHRSMLSLGPLINMTANIDLPNVSREPQSRKEATLGNWARFPMFVLNVDDPDQPFDSATGERALELIYKGAQYSQLALISPTKQILLTRRDKEGGPPEQSALKVYDSNTELHQIITEFSKLPRPLFVKNEQGDYGIFSIYEFKQDHVFPQFQAHIYDAIGGISNDGTKNSLLNQFSEVCHALFTDESEETEEAFQKFCQNLVHAR